MELPSVTQILEIHHKALIRFGGEKGVLLKDQLLSFTDNMRQALHFGKKNKIELAAWILVRLVQNHYFMDGNKRTGLATMLNFLKSNGCIWSLPEKDYFYNLTMYVAKSEGVDMLEYAEKKLKDIIICK